MCKMGPGTGIGLGMGPEGNSLGQDFGILVWQGDVIGWSDIVSPALTLGECHEESIQDRFLVL